MSPGALEPRTDSSRTRRIQPRQRESLQRTISGPNGPFFGPTNLNFSTRDFARPATKRTFERAGVDREGNKKEPEPEKAEADAAAGEGDAAAGGEKEDDGSESADTMDQMYAPGAG